MTAGLWSLKHLSKGLYKQLADLGAELTDGLQTPRGERELPCR